MSTSTDRQSFREVVALVVEKARAVLPASVNGRIEGAVKLVLAHDVIAQADGTIEVGSSTDPLKVYTLSGQTCTCKDFTDGKAPEGWCRHRIAAGIHRRVGELQPVQDDLGHLETRSPAPETAPQPLPEAPASANCHLLIAGRQVQLTLRGTSEEEVLARLEKVLQRYPVPQPPAQTLSREQHNAAAMHRPTTGFCAVHNVEMRWNEGKDGRKGWHSHRQDDGWCKGHSR